MRGGTDKKMVNYVYTLPCKPGSVYVNLGGDCLNDCRFCVRRFGDFFGYELGKGYSGNVLELIEEKLKRIKQSYPSPKEIVICGIGEPFLHYDGVIEVSRLSKALYGNNVPVRADTAGLWWGSNRNLSFLDYIDSLSVSLNAESQDKYERICQPKIPAAYHILTDFLSCLAEEKERREEIGDKFPDIRLTVVDTSRKEFLPPRKETDPQEDCPIPDFEKCKEIAENLGFPLIVKHLFIDSDQCWDPKEIETKTLGGKYMEKCISCSKRHI